MSEAPADSAEKREEQADAEDEKAADQAQFERHPGELADRLRALLSPVLRRENDQRVSDGDRCLLHQKEDLVDCRGAGERGLTVTSQHNVVGHVDTVRHKVLKGDHCHQAEKGLVEIAVMGKERFASVFLRIHLIYPLCCVPGSGRRVPHSSIIIISRNTDAVK